MAEGLIATLSDFELLKLWRSLGVHVFGNFQAITVGWKARDQHLYAAGCNSLAPDRPSLDWLLKTRFSDHFEPLVGWEAFTTEMTYDLYILYILQYLYVA